MDECFQFFHAFAQIENAFCAVRIHVDGILQIRFQTKCGRTMEHNVCVLANAVSLLTAEAEGCRRQLRRKEIATGYD